MKICFLLLSLGALGLTKHMTLQDAYDRCRDVPRDQIESCVMGLINDLQPLILDGIPELGLSTEEVPIEDLDFDEQSGDNYIKARFYEGKIKGFHDMHMKRLKVDYDKKIADWAILYPEYRFSGKYELDANILFFPLRGEGTCWFRCTDLLLKGISHFDVQNFDGEPHLQELETDFNFEYKNMSARLNNLFDGDPLLMEAGAAFVNQNVDVMVDELRPSVAKSFKEIGGNTLNRILRQIKIEDIAGHQNFHN